MRIDINRTGGKEEKKTLLFSPIIIVIVVFVIEVKFISFKIDYNDDIYCVDDDYD